MVYAYPSVALLVGLLLNAVAGWWWADAAAALIIAAVALREGRESWRGEGCCDAAKHHMDKDASWKFRTRRRRAAIGRERP
jgi:divalent metal cation (Fe/Co/Zn/Cd) transporter